MHVFSVIDSYVSGFALQEQQLPFETPEELENAASELVRRMPPTPTPTSGRWLLSTWIS